MEHLKPRQVAVFHVFVASPADMQRERLAVRDFFDEYNRTTAAQWGVRFDVIDWENYSTAGVGRAQSLITKQTLEKYKDSLALVIGLMGERFGSPTGVHGSGTEEEFEWAFEQNRKKGFPEIKWFFRNSDSFNVTTNDIETIREAVEQYEKVQAFKKRVRDEDGPCLYYIDFRDDKFAQIFRNDLALWLGDQERPWVQEGHQPEYRETGAIHLEIDKACVHIRERNPSAAIAMLNDLRKRSWDKLSKREQYRILANLGHAHRLKRDNARAATYYIDAKKCQPDDEDAKCLEALAEHMLGHMDAAHRIASDVLRENPRSTTALEIWILSAPDDQRSADLRAKIPADLIDDVEVSFGLARRAMQAGEHNQAEKYARHALRASPDDPDVQLLLGQAILCSQVSKLRSVLAGARVKVNEQHVQEASELLSKAIDRYTALGAQMDAATARGNRGLAKQLLGNTQAALRDLATAFELAPHAPEVSSHYIKLLGRTGEQEQVIELLRKLLEDSGDATTCLSLASALGQRGQQADILEAIDILKNLLEVTPGVPSEITREALFILAELYAVGRQADALKSLPDSEAAQRLDAESLLALRAVAKLRAGDQDGAESLAAQALSMRSDSTPQATGVRLGHLFRQLNMLPEVLQSLGNVLEPTCVDDDVRLLLDSAHQTGDDRFVLDFCAELRQNGIIDLFCVELETNTLVRYHAEWEAIQVLSQTLEAGIDEFLAKQVRLNRSLIASRINASEFVELELSALPAAEEASPTIGARMVALLSESDHPEQAAAYAYSLFRNYPNDHIAHMAVIMSLNVGTEREVSLPSFDKVEPGTAVVYVVEGASEPKWCIVEDLPDPQPMLNEIGPDDPFAVELMGKAVGDMIVTNKGGMQERTAEIKGILHKYVRRFQDCFSGWEERFPEIPFVWRVDIRHDEAGTPDISSILHSIDVRAAQVDELEASYRDSPLPLHVISNRLGGSVIQLIEHLSVKQDISVRCCSGSTASVEAAMRGISAAEAIVIDSTALATLFVLDGLDLLEAIPAKRVIAAGTMDELRESLRDFDRRIHSGGALAKQGAGYVWTKALAQETAQYRNRLSTLIDFVDERCAIEPGTALAEIPSGTRNGLIDLFGRGGAESIALARGRKRLIWTDDFPLGAIASNEHNVSRVWTQVLSDWLAQNGHVGVGRADEVALKLLLRGYFFTSLRASTVVKAAEDAAWQCEVDPLRSVIDYFALPGLDSRTVWLLAGQSLALLWRSTAVDAVTRDVTKAILDSIACRADGTMIVDSLLGSLDAFFGLDVVNAHKAKLTLAEWFGDDVNRTIIVP